MKKVLVLVSLICLSLSSCSPDPYKDCYKKNYKQLKEMGRSDANAAMVAKRRCDNRK